MCAESIPYLDGVAKCKKHLKRNLLKFREATLKLYTRYFYIRPCGRPKKKVTGDKRANCVL